MSNNSRDIKAKKSQCISLQEKTKSTMEWKDLGSLVGLDRPGFGLLFLFHGNHTLLHGSIGHAFVQGNVLTKGQKRPKIQYNTVIENYIQSHFWLPIFKQSKSWNLSYLEKNWFFLHFLAFFFRWVFQRLIR